MHQALHTAAHEDFLKLMLERGREREGSERFVAGIKLSQAGKDQALF